MVGRGVLLIVLVGVVLFGGVVTVVAKPRKNKAEEKIYKLKYEKDRSHCITAAMTRVPCSVNVAFVFQLFWIPSFNCVHKLLDTHTKRINTFFLFSTPTLNLNVTHFN